jgi:hypothetical protein
MATATAMGNFGGGAEKEVASISVDPPTATLVVESGAPGKQTFKAVAKLVDGTTRDVAASWTATNLPVGDVTANTGIYTANAKLGGVVTVSATYKGKKAEAALTVRLHLFENPNNVPAATIAALKGATMPDPAIQWAYPYDGTVFPRGLAAPQLMWNNGAAADAYYVHLTSTTFDLESFATVAPPSRYSFLAATWQRFVDSTSGAASLTVSRFSNNAAKIVAKHAWTIAPASMRGTIYYWANNQAASCASSPEPRRRTTSARAPSARSRRRAAR